MPGYVSIKRNPFLLIVDLGLAFGVKRSLERRVNISGCVSIRGIQSTVSRQTVFPQGMFYASWEHQHRLTTSITATYSLLAHKHKHKYKYKYRECFMGTPAQTYHYHHRAYLLST